MQNQSSLHSSTEGTTTTSHTPYSVVTGYGFVEQRRLDRFETSWGIEGVENWMNGKRYVEPNAAPSYRCVCAASLLRTAALAVTARLLSLITTAA